MSVDNRRNILDIISLNPNKPEDFTVLKEEYRAVDIDKVKINGNTFTNYGAYSFIWEKTYIKSPDRAGDGSIRDLNAHATFLTGHFTIDFSIISIDDYRALMQLHYAQNEFIVECYDPIYNQKIALNMYFATEEMAKLHIINRKIWNKNAWEDWLILAGVRDYQLEMISTNSDLTSVSVIYHLNPPSNVSYIDTTAGEPSVYMGEEVIIGSSTDFENETFNNLYKFTSWNTKADGSGTTFLDGYAYTINSDLVLYAQWESVEQHTLTFSYGLAETAMEEAAEESNISYITQRKVKKDSSIGMLPAFENPFVEYATPYGSGAKEKYYPYTNGAWYKIAQKTPNASQYLIVNNETYWKNRDGSAYLLFDIKSYNVRYYHVRDGITTLVRTTKVEYNSQVPLFSLTTLQGVTVSKWYTSPEMKQNQQFSSGTMPPYDFNLYCNYYGDKEG